MFEEQRRFFGMLNGGQSDLHKVRAVGIVGLILLSDHIPVRRLFAVAQREAARRNGDRRCCQVEGNTRRYNAWLSHQREADERRPPRASDDCSAEVLVT